MTTNTTAFLELAKLLMLSPVNEEENERDAELDYPPDDYEEEQECDPEEYCFDNYWENLKQ